MTGQYANVKRNLSHAHRITTRKQLRLLIFTLSLSDTNTLITTDLRQATHSAVLGQISDLMAAIYLSEQFSCVSR